MSTSRRVYWVEDQVHVGIYMSSTSQPGDPDDPSCQPEKLIDYAAEFEKALEQQFEVPEPWRPYEASDSNHDDLVSAIVERLSNSYTRHLVVSAVDEAETQWFARICDQLNDCSVELGELSLNVNSRLPLHMLMPKISSCHTLHLYFSTIDGKAPLVLNNGMLHQLSQRLGSNTIGGVEVMVHDNEQARAEQLQTLLQHAASFTFQLLDHQLYKSQSTVAKQLAAGDCRKLRVILQDDNDNNYRRDAQVAHLTQFLHTVSLSVTSLNLHVALAWNGSAMQSLLDSVRSMSRLRSLQVFAQHQGLRDPVKTSPPLLVQLLELSSVSSGLPLESFKVNVDELILRLHDQQYGRGKVLQQVRNTLEEVRPSILNGHVSVARHSVFEQGDDAKLAPYQLIFDDMAALIICNRADVQITVHDVLHLRHMNEPRIAQQILQYVHKCFTA